MMCGKDSFETSNQPALCKDNLLTIKYSVNLIIAKVVLNQILLFLSFYSNKVVGYLLITIVGLLLSIA